MPRKSWHVKRPSILCAGRQGEHRRCGYHRWLRCGCGRRGHHPSDAEILLSANGPGPSPGPASPPVPLTSPCVSAAAASSFLIFMGPPKQPARLTTEREQRAHKTAARCVSTGIALPQSWMRRLGPERPAEPPYQDLSITRCPLRYSKKPGAPARMSIDSSFVDSYFVGFSFFAKNRHA
jgi:hypothetical protein